MSRKRMHVRLGAAAVTFFCTARLSTAWLPMVAPAIVLRGTQQEEKAVAKPMRAPIRTGGTGPGLNLIYRVEPEYPELARKARVSGTVILQVIINELGEVYEAKVVKGHPLLQIPALKAVKQWRYAPTFVNGVPVPLLATVAVPFYFSSSPRMGMRIDEHDVDSIFHKDVWYALVGAPVQNAGTKKTSANSGTVTPPVIALDAKRLTGIAESSGLTEKLPADQMPLIYRIYVSEAGQIVDIEQLRGPKIPAVENELIRTPVLSPGKRGNTPVPVAFYVEVQIP